MVRRRNYDDPLKPIPAGMWLVAQDRIGNVSDLRELAASADLRAVLTAERGKRMADGWVADEIGRASSGFYCARDGERIEVGILRRDRASPGSFAEFAQDGS